MKILFFISFILLFSSACSLKKKSAEYRGNITFYSYDSTRTANPSVFDVVDESILNDDFCDPNLDHFEYFYVVNENTCQVCDYIDYEGIWTAYAGTHGSYGARGLERVEWFLLE